MKNWERNGEPTILDNIKGWDAQMDEDRGLALFEFEFKFEEFKFEMMEEWR